MSIKVAMQIPQKNAYMEQYGSKYNRMGIGKRHLEFINEIYYYSNLIVVIRMVRQGTIVFN